MTGGDGDGYIDLVDLWPPQTMTVRRRLVTAIAMGGAGLALLLGGCSLAGTWTTDPASDREFAENVFATVTFGADGRYTATRGAGARTVTSMGSYTWNGSRLVVQPSDGPPTELRGRVRAGSRLTLVCDDNGQSMVGELRRHNPKRAPISQ